MIVVVGGLPGTGKSTLADAIGQRLALPVVAKDIVEASLWRSGVGAEHGSWRAANDLLVTLADTFLGQGLDGVVLDAVFRIADDRQALRDLAASRGVRFVLIECICSDEAAHRQRIEGRRRDIPGWYELSWADVESVRARYEPWEDARLVLDASDAFEQNLERALAALTATAD
jgi:predicted kinase